MATRQPSFEEELVPLRDRVVCAMGNLAHDIATAHPKLKRELDPWVARIRGFLPEGLAPLTHVPKPRILVANFLLPVGCNATCPKVCATDVNEYRTQPDDLKLEEIIKLLHEAKRMGARIARIVGIGEPILYPGLPVLARVASSLRLPLLVCTNGLVVPSRVLEAYAEPSSTLRFEVKLWSEDAATQTRLVRPKNGQEYRYEVDTDLGPVPHAFARLREANADRVGFRVLVYNENRDDAKKILEGPKPQKVHLYVDRFITQGEGRAHAELRVDDPRFKPTCFFEQPPWPYFAASVKQNGELVRVLEKTAVGVSVRESLERVWRTAFTELEMFRSLRYGEMTPEQL